MREGTVTKEESEARVKLNMAKVFRRKCTVRSSKEVPWVINRTSEIVNELDEDVTLHHSFCGGQKMFVSADGKHRYWADGR